MKNTIQINLGADHTLECDEKIIGRSGEGLVSRLEVTIPEALTNYDVYIDFEKPNGELLRTPKLEVEYGVAFYDVPKYLLAESGEIKLQLVFANQSGATWKSSKKRYNILKSINAVDEIPEKEDFISQAQRLIDELNQEVADIADMLANNDKFAQAVIDACGGQTKITTINGVALRFFVGTQAKYDELNDAEKQNLFAIITDDTIREDILAKLDVLDAHTEQLGEHEGKINGAEEVIGNLVNGLVDGSASSWMSYTMFTKGGVQKDDLNFISDSGGWSPDPCGNYFSYGSTNITLQDGTTETITGWQLKGFHIVDDNYLQLLITKDKIYMRMCLKANNNRILDNFLQIAGEGTRADKATEAVRAINKLTSTIGSGSIIVPVGSLLTLGLTNDEWLSDVAGHRAGKTISVTLYGGADGLEEYVTISKTGTERTLAGTWQIVGYCGKSADGYHFLLIRRIS